LVPVFLYDGVEFKGDLPVSNWEYFMSVLKPRFEAGEYFIVVTNFQDWPRPGRESIVEILTCTEPTDGGGCQRGSWWDFSPTADGWSVLHDGFWISIPENKIGRGAEI
jgi:hypothetical protein